MSVDELLQVLEREAAAEAASIRLQAQAEAEALERAGDRRAAAHTEAALAKVRAGRQVAADARVAAVARRRRRDVLLARAAALDRVQAAASAALPQLLAGADGGEVLAHLIAGVTAAAAAADPTAAAEPLRVRCPPDLVGRVGALLATRPGVEVVADASVTGGVLAERADGRVTIDARLSTCLDRWWPRLRVDVRPPDEAP